MPGGDGTGPAGMGPMTGRAAGFCVGYAAPGYANFVGGCGYWGRGMGRGRGFGVQGGGRGWRNQFYATGLPGWARPGFGFSGPVGPTVTPNEELESLKQQAEFLQNSLSQVSERIGQLEKENKK